MSDAFELEICQGKYRYRYEAGKQEVWRNGEPWEVMNGRLIGDKFVFSLAVELDEALKERDALRAKIETMEKQEPVWWQARTRPTWNDGTWLQWRKCSEGYAQDIKKTPLLHDWLYEARALYALPGAQPAPNVPEGWQLVPTAESRHPGIYKMLGALHAADNTPGMSEWESYRAMLAAAPEAKP